MSFLRSKAGSVARAHRPDYVLMISIFVLLAFGLIMMYNINPALSQKLTGSVDQNYYFRNQLVNVLVGLGVWFVASRIPYQKWRDWAPWVLGAAIIGLAALWVPGLAFEKNGATRWIHIGPASFQPAELLKFAMVIYLAAWFEKRGRDLKSWSDGVVPFGIMLLAASIVVVVFQRDLGTMLVMAFASLGMFFVAGIRWQHFLSLIGIGLALGWASIAAFPHRMSRLATFLDPGKDAAGGGYHVSQALIGIGSGGLFGLGLGKSIQIYGYLPEASNDSIFAVIAEEFGLVGSLLLIGLFGLLVYRGLKIAENAPDVFSRLLAAGITLVFLFQAIINIAAMLALVPLTGIPLPFISYGGSSLVLMLLGAGILVNISKYTTKENRNATSSQWRGVGRSRDAGPRDDRSPAPAR